MPRDYSEKTIENIVKSEESLPETGEKRPNILFLQLESFFDPTLVEFLDVSEDPIPTFRKFMEEYSSGYFKVPSVGAGTANTEFEYLTGASMAFLPYGSIPYQQYVKKETPSMASYLSSLGYYTIAMHPYRAAGWDRNLVYPRLGFDEMHFQEFFTDSPLVRKYVSDEGNYEKIIKLYEEKDADTPLFLFNVTMQNHSSYTESFANFQPDIKVEGTESAALNNYLSLMKLSDEALQDLIAYFEGQDEETIIVFFGDHQPTNSVVEPVWKLNGKRNSTLTEEEVSRRYKVPFLIWANYEIDEEQDVETSANYLGTKTLEAAGLPMPAYFSYLAAFSQEVPVISANHVDLQDGTFTNAEDQESLLSQYKGYQYYQLFDSSTRK